MRIGNFEVTVVRQDGRAFPGVHDRSTGTTYVVAEPGALYAVNVARLDASTKKMYRATLKVDGKCVGVAKLLMHPNSSTTFRGFVKQGSSAGVMYNLFKFAAAESDEGREATSAVFREGRMTAVVHEVVAAGGDAYAHHSTSYGASSSKVAQLPEGKKFFLAPSLATASGGVASGSGFSTRRYDNVGPDLATFELRYETAATLLLRQVLHRDNPVHAAILNSFPETRAQPAVTQSEAATQAAGARGATVKRERSGAGPSGQQQQSTTEHVDLTGRSRPAPAERLAPGEELVCDMTGDDDSGGAPLWTKRRRP